MLQFIQIMLIVLDGWGNLSSQKWVFAHSSVSLLAVGVWFSVGKMFLAEIYMIPITVYMIFMMPNINSKRNHENKEY